MANQSETALKLKSLRERTGMSVREVAAAIGKAPSTYATYEDKYKKDYLPMGLVEALIPIFSRRGIQTEELLELAGVTRGAIARPTEPPAALADVTLSQSSAAHEDEVRYAGPVELSAAGGSRGQMRMLPVRAIRGSADDDLVLDDEIIDYIPMPQELQHVPGAYAAYVVGDSMAPRYFAGETVLVNPTKPARQGMFVVAIRKPARVYIKLLRRLSPTEVELHSLAEGYPPVIFPRSELLALHLITGTRM